MSGRVNNRHIYDICEQKKVSNENRDQLSYLFYVGKYMNANNNACTSDRCTKSGELARRMYERRAKQIMIENKLHGRNTRNTNCRYHKNSKEDSQCRDGIRMGECDMPYDLNRVVDPRTKVWFPKQK